MDQQPTYAQANGMENGHAAAQGYPNDKASYAINAAAPQQLQQQQQQQLQQQPINNTRHGNNYQTSTPVASLQQFPAPVDCPVCGVREMTITNPETGGYTHAMAAIACICCLLGCIPYMMSAFKNVMHRCGSCGAPLALWHRSGSTEVLAHR